MGKVNKKKLSTPEKNKTCQIAPSIKTELESVNDQVNNTVSFLSAADSK